MIPSLTTGVVTRLRRGEAKLRPTARKLVIKLEKYIVEDC